MGNILGGIAIQTVVLVILDVFGNRHGPPLTYRAASPVLVVEGLLVLAVLVVVVAGTQLPDNLVFARVAPGGLLIVVLWVVGLLLVSRAHTALPWHESGEAPDGQDQPRGHSQETAGKRAVSTARSATVCGVAALVTLVAGVFLERSGDAVADGVGLSGVLFGATVLALATSLPEISTGLHSVRQGDDQLAVSDIFGGNAFLPVLFLLASLISGTAVLPQAQATDIYLTAVGMLLTVVYLAGLLFRPKRRVAGDGHRLAGRARALHDQRGGPLRHRRRRTRVELIAAHGKIVPSRCRIDLDPFVGRGSGGSAARPRRTR